MGYFEQPKPQPGTFEQPLTPPPGTFMQPQSADTPATPSPRQTEDAPSGWGSTPAYKKGDVANLPMSATAGVSGAATNLIALVDKFRDKAAQAINAGGRGILGVAMEQLGVGGARMPVDEDKPLLTQLGGQTTRAVQQSLKDSETATRTARRSVFQEKQREDFTRQLEMAKRVKNDGMVSAIERQIKELDQVDPDLYAPLIAVNNLLMADDQLQQRFAESQESLFAKTFGGIAYGAGDFAVMYLTGRALNPATGAAFTKALQGIGKASQGGRVSAAASGLVANASRHSSLPLYMGLQELGREIRTNPDGSWTQYQGAFGRGALHGAAVGALFTGGTYIPGVPIRSMASKILRRQQKMLGTSAFMERTEKVISKLGYGALVLGFPEYDVPSMTSGAFWMATAGEGQGARKFHEHRWQRQQYARAAAPRPPKTTILADGPGGEVSVNLLEVPKEVWRTTVQEPFAKEWLASPRSGWNMSKGELEVVTAPNKNAFAQSLADYTRDPLTTQRLQQARMEYGKHLADPSYNAENRNLWLVNEHGVTSTTNFDKAWNPKVEHLVPAEDVAGGPTIIQMGKGGGTTGEIPPPDPRIGIPLKKLTILGEMVAGKVEEGSEKPPPIIIKSAKGAPPFEISQTANGQIVAEFIMPKGNPGEKKRHVAILEEVPLEPRKVPTWKAEGVPTAEMRGLRARTTKDKREAGLADPSEVDRRKQLQKKAEIEGGVEYKVIGVEEVIAGKPKDWYVNNDVVDHDWNMRHYRAMANNYVVRVEREKGFVGKRLQHYVENENRRTKDMDRDTREQAMYGAMARVLKRKLDTPESREKALRDMTIDDFYRVQHKLTHWGLKADDIVNSHKFKVDPETGEIDPDSNKGVRPIQKWEADAMLALKEQHSPGLRGGLRSLGDMVENPIYTMEKLGENIKFLFWHPMIEAEGQAALAKADYSAKHKNQRKKFEEGMKWRDRRDAYDKIGLLLMIEDPDGAATHQEMTRPQDQIFVRTRTVDPATGKVTYSEPAKDSNGNWVIKPEYYLTPKEQAMKEWYKDRFAHLTEVLNRTRRSVGKQELDGITGYYPMFRLLNSVKDGWAILERETQADIQKYADQADAVMKAFKTRKEEGGLPAKMYGKFQQTLGKVRRPGSSPTIQVLHHQKQRTGSTIPVVVDVRKTYGSLMNNIIRFSYTEPTLHGLRQLLDYTPQDGHGMRAVTPNSWRTMDEWLRYNAGESIGETAGTGMKAVNAVARRMALNMHYSQLSGNLRTAMIQLSAGRGPWLFAGKKNTMKGFSASRSERHRAWLESNVLRTRIRAGTDIQESIDHGGVRNLIEASSLLGKVATGLGRAQVTLGDVGFKPLEWVDSYTSTSTWLSFNYQAKGWGWDSKRAAQYADEWTAKTAGTTTRANRTPIQRSELGRLVTMFQNFNLADFNLLVNEVGRAEGTRGEKNLSQGARIVKTLDYLLATAAINMFYEDFMPAVLPSGVKNLVFGGGRVYSPFPTWLRELFGTLSLPLPNVWDEKQRNEFLAGPVAWWGKEYKSRWDAVQTAWEGDGWKARVGAAMKEMAELIPVVGGGVKYGSSPLGPGVEVATNIAEDVAQGEWAGFRHTIAKGVIGVPMLSQARKTRRGAEKVWPEAFGKEEKKRTLPPQIARRLREMEKKYGWSEKEKEKQTALWEMIYFLDDTLVGRTRPRKFDR